MNDLEEKAPRSVSARGADEQRVMTKHMSDETLEPMVLPVTEEEVQSLLNGIARRMGVDELSLDENGVVSLVVDRSLEVNLFFASYIGAFVASTPFVEAGAVTLSVLQRLAGLNLNWNDVGGGAFSIPPECPYLTYSKLIPLVAGDVDTLDQEIAAFGFTVIQIDQFIQAVGIEQMPGLPGDDEIHIAS